jgi:hypothetical protein
MKNIQKILLWLVAGITLSVVLIALAGMYKFNYLAGKEGYDVDGNKIYQAQEEDISDAEEGQGGILIDDVCAEGMCTGDRFPEDMAVTTITVPLIFDDLTGSGSFGCGVDVELVPFDVPETLAVLDASYQMLFTLPHEPLPEFRNTVVSYENLQYDSVAIVDGVAKLKLNGSLYGPGHCAEPELRGQISRTALQFPTVDTVEVYLNDELYDWCELDVSDGEGGCNDGPMYWIDS